MSTEQHQTVLNISSAGALTLIDSMCGKVINVNTVGVNSIVIPTNASSPIGLGFTVTILNNVPTGTLAFTIQSGVTVYNSGTVTPYASGGTTTPRSMVSLLKSGTDEWYIVGTNVGL